jgi:hypothetical protein
MPIQHLNGRAEVGIGISIHPFQMNFSFVHISLVMIEEYFCIFIFVEQKYLFIIINWILFNSFKIERTIILGIGQIKNLKREK